VVEHK